VINASLQKGSPPEEVVFAGNRLARDYERLPEALAGFHVLAFAILMLKRFVSLDVARS
jgi:hypothetical protein